MNTKLKGRPRKQNKLISFSCSLKQEQLEKLKTISNEEGEDISVIIRKAVDGFIKEKENE